MYSPCIYLFALSFTAKNEAGIALVSAKNAREAFSILKRGGKYNGFPERYLLVDSTKIGIYTENRYELLLEMYTNALVAYQAIKDSIAAVYTYEELISVLGYTPADVEDLNRKVDKVEGMGLSEANFTAEEKRLLARLGESIISVIKVNGNIVPIVQGVVDITVPTKVSDLANDVGFITSSVDNLVNYYLKSETYTKDEVVSLIGAIQQFHYEIYASTSAVSAPQGNVLYLIGPTGSGSDRYEEYVYANNTWTKIGDTSIDLSGYVTTTDLNTALANYTSTADLNTLLAGKQDTISDLSTIRSGASAGATAYQKPAGGIPKTDMTTGVQTSLNKADSALQPGDAPLIFDPVSCGDDFVYRRSPATGDGTASIEQVRGKSLVWNQLVDGTYAYGSKGTMAITGNSYEFTVTEQDDNTSRSFMIGNMSKITGHKYYYHFDISTTSQGTIGIATGLNTFAGDTTTVITAGEKTRQSLIVTLGDSGAALQKYIYFYYNRGTDNPAVNDKITVSNLIAIDLTLLFGAGNESSTVAEFEALFPLPYYAYNAGTIINNKAEAIETVGFNQWDEEWEAGTINGNTGQNEATNNTFRAKNYIPVFPNTAYYVKRPNYSTDSRVRIFEYDANKNYLGLSYNTNNGIITLSANTRYIRFRLVSSGPTYNHDICINLSDPAKNGTYAPYEKHTLELNVTTLTGKLDGEGESVTIAPDGLKSAGAVYDYGVVENGYITKIVKRIGTVDMGTLTWTYRTSGSGTDSGSSPFFDAMVSGSKNEFTAICSKYQESRSLFLAFTDKTFTGTAVQRYYNVSVRDAAYTDAAAFKTAMSGVMLNYELAEPQIYVLDTPIPATFQSYKGGMERRLPEDTASIVNAPFSGTISYYGLGAETKKTLDMNYVQSSKVVVLTASAYEALITKDPDTFYLTYEEE